MCETEQKSAPGRGRPRGFDKDLVAKQTRDLFSTKGLSGTSMDEIAESTGLFRTSLAAAFTNKRGIFLAALAEYRGEARRVMTDAFARETIQESLVQLYSNAIDTYVGTGKIAPGCFFISTATAEATTDGEIRTAVADYLSELENGLVTRFTTAKNEENLNGDASPEILAEMISSSLVRIAVLARAGTSSSKLQDIAMRTIDFVTGPALR